MKTPISHTGPSNFISMCHSCIPPLPLFPPHFLFFFIFYTPQQLGIFFFKSLNQVRFPHPSPSCSMANPLFSKAPLPCPLLLLSPLSLAAPGDVRELLLPQSNWAVWRAKCSSECSNPCSTSCSSHTPIYKNLGLPMHPLFPSASETLL